MSSLRFCRALSQLSSQCYRSAPPNPNPLPQKSHRAFSGSASPTAPAAATPLPGCTKFSAVPQRSLRQHMRRHALPEQRASISTSQARATLKLPKRPPPPPEMAPLFSPTGDFPLDPGTTSHDFATCVPTGRARGDTVGTARTASETENRSPLMQPELRRTRTMKASTEYTQIAAGLEPGLDPDQDIDDERTKALKGDCQITVVQYSEDKLEQYELLGEDQMKEFLTKPREDWVKVRWINCGGLSWGVIKEIKRAYNLHPLAIEDMLEPNRRPKCDWYSDHAFVILPLLKCIELKEDDSHGYSATEPPLWSRALRRILLKKRGPTPAEVSADVEKSQWLEPSSRNTQRSLQKAYGGPNYERVKYMEAHSTLKVLDKFVHVEQVSVFLTADGTIISFFEISGDDIEPPILQRLYSTKTLLRTSADPSMMLQAIIDTVVDLSFEIVSSYQDAMAEIELSVLTDPSIKQSQELYILTSELSLLKSAISPIAGVITSIRDHRRAYVPTVKGLSGVEVSDMTRTYLGDVLDHVILIIDHMETMKRSADNLIDLIFNTIGSLQNESMKQLTTITIVFLPLSFIAGYFGMNFEEFPVLKNPDTEFWKSAGPLLFITLCYCMRETVGRGLYKKFQRRTLKRARKVRREGGGAAGREGKN